VLREEIVMYSDYNESTRRFRNPGRIEDFWDQQGKVLHMGKKLLQFLWQQVCYGLLGQPEERMLACLQVLLVMLLHKE
jgi:hypothetical protein